MLSYTVVRSQRKSISIEVTRQLEVVVRAPFLLPAPYINKFVKSREKWLNDALERMKQRIENEPPELSQKQTDELIERARRILPQKVKKYSEIMNLYPTAVKITSAKTRFGSCSGKNSVCFSYRLMLYPDSAVDYVVVHELAHIRHKNHGSQFYLLIEQFMPDYKDRVKLLKKSL